MMIPAFVFFIVFSYIPMPGAYFAFTKYEFRLGYFRSPSIGLGNFAYLFKSGILSQLTIKTLLYNLAFILFGNVAQILCALFLNDLGSKRFVRVSQTIIFLDCSLPSLIHFYDACVARIRSVDPNHMFSIEGAHWARDTRVFNHLYDPNMCIHFHAYWTLPQKALFEPYMELSEKYQVPLWLGETGENTNEWFTTIFPLLDELGISWNYWQWKKSIRENSNLVVRQPEGWQQMIDFVKGGPHPGFENGKRMLDEWLVNCRAENCRVIPEVTHSILRQPGITIPALSYMEGGHSHESFCERDYRNMDGMQYLTRYGAAPEIDPSHAHGDSNIRTDHPWRMYDLLLKKGEYASYLLRPNQTPSAITLVGYAPDGDAELEVEVDGVRSVLSIPHALRPAPIGRISIPAIPETTLRLTTLTASVALEKIDFTEA